MSTGSYQNHDLADIFFGSVDMPGVNLAGQDLTDSQLWYANLPNANFSGANLTNADLREATLTGANLTRPRCAARGSAEAMAWVFPQRSSIRLPATWLAI